MHSRFGAAVEYATQAAAPLSRKAPMKQAVEGMNAAELLQSVGMEKAPEVNRGFGSKESEVSFTSRQFPAT
jgi:hypothetical protein